MHADSSFVERVLMKIISTLLQPAFCKAYFLSKQLNS